MGIFTSDYSSGNEGGIGIWRVIIYVPKTIFSD